MIYLGINASTFTVNKNDITHYRDANGNENPFMIGLSVDYKGFWCITKAFDTETISIQLVSNNPIDYIPIIV